MDTSPLDQRTSEEAFAACVARLSADPGRVGALIALLQESHPAYSQRGAAATVRMRGWVLLALARHGLPDAALVYALEELDTGRDPYLVAAAAHALRTRPDPAFAPYLARAASNVREHDDFVSLATYGGYADEGAGTTAQAEVAAALRELEPIVPGPPSDLAPPRETRLPDAPCCALPWPVGRRATPGASRTAEAAVEATTFEDQDGRPVSFREFFRGRPSAVVFFYTRCDNPRKCSLTVAKLARVQRLIAERGMTGRVRTAAITYDPGWDSPDRLRGYARGRGVQLDADHRVLRCAPDALPALGAHFGLGVNYVESLVNRHRVEAFVLDAEGRVAVTFERVEWDEAELVDHLAATCAESDPGRAPPTAAAGRRASGAGLSAAAPFASLAAALLPKCPICWVAYLSSLGIAGMDRLAPLPWLVPLLGAAMVVNLASLWARGRSSGQMLAWYLGLAGALSLLVLGWYGDVPWARPVGVLLTVSASVVSTAVSWRGLRRAAADTRPPHPAGIHAQ